MKRRKPRFVTTTLVVGTNSLREKFGDQVHEFFSRTYSITMVGHVLFDLLLKSNGSGEFSPEELVQHVEKVVIDDLRIADEQNESFQTSPMKDIVAELYDCLLKQAWPYLKLHSLFLQSARVASINYHLMEINMTKLE